MALFKINRGVNANLPTARHDGYAYFTTDDGKFYIDFADPGGVLQADGTTVERKALNAERADYVGYSLKMYYDGTESTEGSYNGLIQRTYDITPEKINAVRRNGDTIPGPLTLTGEAVFNNVVYLNDETYADSMTIGNAIITGALKVIGPINGSVVNAPTLNGNATSADKVNHKLKVSFDSTPLLDYDGSTMTGTYADANGNTLLDITPESINAVRRNGDTISGPLTINGVFTVNNDAYIDSATIGNLLVNGGTRFVGAVNAGTITASSFVGPLTGNASTADKVNHKLKLQINGNNKGEYDGHDEYTFNVTTEDLGVLSTSTFYALGDAVGGNAVKANALNLNAAVGSTTRPVYFKSDGTPDVISNSSEIDLVAKLANSLSHSLKYRLRGSDIWAFDGSAQTANDYKDANGNTVFDLVPNDIGIFDTLLGSTVTGESTFNNVVYLNDETYADSMTIENALVTGALRVVGDINGNVVNAPTLNGNATSASKVNYKLKLQANGNNKGEYDGHEEVTINYTASDVGALPADTAYAAGDANHNALLANALNLSGAVGSSLLPVYFKSDGTPEAVSTSSEINILARTANLLAHKLKVSFDSNPQVEFDGTTLSAQNGGDANGNTLLDITPEAINAVRRNGDTIPGPLTLNGVFTVNNDAYIDSATIGDLLVNGGTRFIGAVNAGTITASSFVGPLTGNATTADKVNHKLKILFNGNDQYEFDGSALAAANGGDANGNTIVNITPTDIHAVDDRGDTMTGALTVGDITVGGASGTVAGRTIASNNTLYLNRKANTSLIFQLGGTEHARFDTSGDFIPASGSTTTIGTSSRPWTNIYATTFTGNATSADKVNHSLKYRLRGNDIWAFDGGTCNYEPVSDANGNTIFDLVPNDMGIFDTILGSTVSGESTFNNVVYLNDETYADSITIGNGLVTGAFRIVGDLNASIINATTLNGNATSADKVNYKLKILFNGTNKCEFDGTGIGTNNDEDTIVNVTPEDIAAAPAVNGIYYGTCATAKATKAKEVILVNGTGFLLVAGAMLVVKFTNASAAATMTLKVGTDAESAAAATGHTLYQYGTTKMADGTGTSGWPAGAVVLFIYDGTSWFRQFWYNNTYTLPTVTNIDCGTAAATAAKAITNGTWYAETAGNLFEVTMRYANTHAGALTFHSKPIYINGYPSSETNYTLPAGKYIVFYDGTNYYFRTDGLVPHVNGIYKQRYGNSNTKGTTNSRLYFLLSDYIAPTTAYPSDMYNKTIYYKAFYKIRGVSSNPAYTQNSMSGEFSTIVGVKVNNSGKSNLQYVSGFWSQVPTSFGSTSIIYISTDTNVVASRKHAQFYVTSSGTNDFEYEVELISVEKTIIDDANSTVGTPEELHVASYTNGTLESCVFMNMTNTRTNCALLNSSYAGSISNFVYASQALDAHRLINYFTADNGTTNYYLAGRDSTTSGSYSYLYSNTKTYIKGSGLYSAGSLHMNDIYGTSGHTYGSTLPSSPTEGQLFFQIDGATGSGGGSLSLAQKSSGTMYVLGYDGSDNTKAYYNTNVYVDCANGILRGAAWNDYAEYRRDNHIEKRLQKPGNCVKENGDGTLSLTTKRLERGCEIISDTFGMAIGQNAREGYDTPIAVSGRVLAYPYESIEEFKAHIGYPVCSGPNGTVSIMTDEEEEKYSSRIIGTISEIPTYDKWGESQIDVDGRVWIRIK